MKPGIERIVGVRLYFIPVTTRVPLKFGSEVLTSVTCARVKVKVVDRSGNAAEGWGETPLSVQWVWPSKESYEARLEALQNLCRRLTKAWAEQTAQGDPIFIGYSFMEQILPQVLVAENADKQRSKIPWLAALLCNAAFDIALHDAFGHLVERPVYDTYHAEYMTHDLSAFLEPGKGGLPFERRFPCDYLRPVRAERLPAWHLVGGLDPLTTEDCNPASDPRDAYPVTLEEWIATDGLKCLKVKLRGTDPEWDYWRLKAVGQLGKSRGVERLSADFNCTVSDPTYVCEVLDRLKRDDPVSWDMLLYVEQPFPYELEPARIDVSAIATRKPLFLDESAHDWRMIRLGRELGWTGVALKTCKTQTGAILSACWARAHGMKLMVQDLTNPMLAQIPHVLLGAHVETIHGVETNSMQYYPAASIAESVVHPGIYRRVNGTLDLSSIRGPGFGYRISEIVRELPPGEGDPTAPGRSPRQGDRTR